MSKSGLLLSPCLYWAGPKAKAYDETLLSSEQTEKRDLGTEVHQGIKDSIDGIPASESSVKLSDQANKLIGHAEFYLDKEVFPYVDSNPAVPGLESIWAEVCVGINWTTGEGKILHGIGHRDYPNIPGYQFGTADLIWISEEGVLTVLDWKTGESEGVEDQVKSLLCAYNAASGHSGPCQGGEVFLNESGAWPNIRPIGKEELDCHRDSMRWVTEDVAKGHVGTQNPGLHCTKMYCPHLGHCEAISQSVLNAASEAEKSQYAPDCVRRLPMAKASDITKTKFGSDSEAGEVMALVSAAERQTKYIKEALKKYIASGGKVKTGHWEWSDGNNGFRWRKA